MVNKYRFTIYFVIFLTSLTFFTNYSNAESRPDIVKFLQVTGMLNGIQQGAEVYIKEMKKKYPKAPGKFWNQISTSEIKEYTTSLDNYYIEAYSNYFSKDDISAILSFFNTEHGKKLMHVNDVMLHELIGVAMKEEQKLNKSIEKKLEEMNYK